MESEVGSSGGYEGSGSGMMVGEVAAAEKYGDEVSEESSGMSEESVGEDLLRSRGESSGSARECLILMLKVDCWSGRCGVCCCSFPLGCVFEV